jgi:hypothetical protein
MDGIDQIRLARPVGPDDDGNPGPEFEPGPIGERLEADNLESLEVQELHLCD